jgi:conjugative transposon TraN protein
MKRNCAVVGIILIFSVAKSFGQFEKISFINSYPLYITCNKTTNLIFPCVIQNVDRGSRDVLVQKVTGAENILQVKADKPKFSETNLSVITAEGKLYSFIVNYLNEPPQLNIVFQKDTLLSATEFVNIPVIFSRKNNVAELNHTAQKIISASRCMYGVRDRHDAMKLVLNGLYVYNDIYYFCVVIQNKSNISFETEAMRFFITDKQKSKRTATQQTEIRPLGFYSNWKMVKGKSSQSFIVALPKFTLHDEKYLLVQLFEQSGSRELQLCIKNRHLLQAQQPSF